MKVLKFIFVICLSIFCTNINKPEAKSTNEKLLYTWIDKVIVREKHSFIHTCCGQSQSGYADVILQEVK